MNKHIIFVLLLFILNYSCKNDTNKQYNFIIKEDSPDLSVENSVSTYNVNSKLKAKITSPLVNNYSTKEEPYLEFPEGVLVNFYDDNAIEESSMKADYAVYYTNKKLWEAKTNVIVTSRDGGVLTTEQLFGDEQKQKIYSEKYVKVIDKDGSIIEGRGGFESNSNFNDS